MSRIIRKRFILIGLIILAVFSVIFLRTKISPKEVNANSKVSVLSDANTNNLSAWVVYWDLSPDSEIKSINNNLKNVSYFGVYFDTNNNLVIPDGLVSYYSKTKNDSYNKYITIVNDKEISEGKYSHKDVNILKDLLSNEASRSAHIEKIIDLAVKHGFDGIEIDYEKIRKNMRLWNDYILFINELYQKAEDNGLKLRVVLEPEMPFDKLNFSEGPTYVMMCYNLHGSFSGPGEKANPEFIKNLIESMDRIQGKKEFAIATGGFDWGSNGKVNSITEADAVSLLKKSNAEVKRDSESQCLFFSYKDEDDISHEIWYADKITLKSWMNVITEKGYDISIWRLGGNYF